MPRPTTVQDFRVGAGAWDLSSVGGEIIEARGLHATGSKLTLDAPTADYPQDTVFETEVVVHAGFAGIYCCGVDDAIGYRLMLGSAGQVYLARVSASVASTLAEFDVPRPASTTDQPTILRLLVTPDPTGARIAMMINASPWQVVVDDEDTGTLGSWRAGLVIDGVASFTGFASYSPG